MTDDGRADTAVQEEREQTRLALSAMLIPIFFVTLFALCIIGTYHKPHPHGGVGSSVVGHAGVFHHTRIRRSPSTSCTS